MTGKCFFAIQYPVRLGKKEHYEFKKFTDMESLFAFLKKLPNNEVVDLSYTGKTGVSKTIVTEKVIDVLHRLEKGYRRAKSK